MKGNIVKDTVTTRKIANKGRFGDTEIRKVDGDLSHVNAYEAYLIDNYGKEGEDLVQSIGAGTINPKTGKPEYFFTAAASALAIGSSIFKGFGAAGNRGDVKRAKTAAYDIYEEQIGLLGERKDLATEIAGTQYTTGVGDVSTAAGGGIQDVEASADITRSQQNLVTSSIDQKVKAQTGNIWKKYLTDTQKLMHTKTYAEAEADLGYRTGERSAEASYQDTLTQLESVPTTFMEGMFS